MKNNGKSIVKSKENKCMELAILLAINKRIYEQGLITKEEKEKMDIEILREK